MTDVVIWYSSETTTSCFSFTDNSLNGSVFRFLSLSSHAFPSQRTNYINLNQSMLKYDNDEAILYFSTSWSY
jgi:hypothetical protein